MILGLVMHDAQGKLMLFNPRFAEIFKLPPDQIKLGMTYDQVKAITGEPIQKVTLADGSVRWDWMTSMVVFKDQKVTYAGLSHESKGGGAPGGSPAAPSSAPGGG